MEPIISVRHLHKSFGAHQVLADINVDIHGREVVVVIGPSGSGKSTFYAVLICWRSRKRAMLSLKELP